MKAPNLFVGLPDNAPEELLQTLHAQGDVRIERILSLGHTSPPDFWYDQDTAEWVLLLRGAARLRFEDELLEMTAGSYVFIPAHRRHRVDWTHPTEPTIWLALHMSG